jgi:nitroreductase
MNGGRIPDETVQELLALADWAPTHGRTEPWRYFVYSGAAMAAFSQKHAELYNRITPEESRNEATFERLAHCTDKASHMVVAVMQRGANAKIPVIEEIAATSASIEHILLGATALGIASFWSTGGMTLRPEFKELVGAGEEDQVLGMLFLGYTDEPTRDGVRNTPLQDKVKWF